MTRVTIHDLRDARYCLAGVRPWFRRHGLDWQDFLTHGIDADRLRATNDALVEPVIQVAKTRAATMEASDGRA
ncbi:hypothetical protein ROTO_33110 [Roseovarius tolerans]|uniref:Uncharacterized protein n=1 Tax=Roseovarius tolerans TaxID=74031 RepID=A0A0L6CQX5_9RHOB|nr:hypothetical protein [Roseovarius tolerans]KNX40152.1 hypothetical protein ROTO_33110 [Roseovarius tolerans]